MSPSFQMIETLHADRPWGSFLDAGTGRRSLTWVSGLDIECWTAVTDSRVTGISVKSSSKACWK
ncbi:hypothetical protein SAMN05192555_11080 [Franzmannia pantelleriensis]|uniref:Uncharacterized protein n=1 Tax=Franzmannia pantelleriensis TaxID=48727 RepID=A0A1G9R5V8_9GAMM|nr:hypothetical protein [Halomonas pantelleriensis]SDM18603.1 hypothetical protein SAMN05192555_11080 [Halomonas pantelleriensis]